MTVATRKLTAEEYFAFDDGTDNKYELVNGELVLMSVGKGIHTFIIDFLIEHIKAALLELEGQYRTSSSDDLYTFTQGRTMEYLQNSRHHCFTQRASKRIS